MKHARASKADKDRMGLIKSNMPCLPCILKANKVRLPSVQHLVEGRKRLGHQFTYASCEWHHFGMNHGTMTRQDMIEMLGPSLAHGKRAYQEFFGLERLLVSIQDYLIQSFEAEPWMGYSIPHEIRQQASELWLKEKHH